MNKKNLIKIFFVELFISVLYLIYSINIDNNFLLFLSYSLLTLIGYFFCISLVFDKKINIKSLLIYYFFSYLSFIIKYIYLSIYLSDINIIIIIGIITSFLLKILCMVIFSLSIFTNENLGYKEKIKKSLQYVNGCWKKFINLKFIKPFFKILPQNIIIFAFLIINIVYISAFYKNNNDIFVYDKNISDSNIGAIIDPVNVSFKNIEVNTDFNKICFVFGTYGRVNDSNLEFQLFKKDKIISTNKINTKILKDGERYCFLVKNINHNNLKSYYLKIIPSNTDDNNNVTIFNSSETGEFTMTFLKSRTFTSFKFLIIIIFIVIYLLLNYLINKKGSKIKEYKFYLILLIYLIPILFIIPALEVPDEPSHFYSSYNISQNLLDADIDNTLKVPKNFDCLNYAGIESHDVVEDMDKIFSCLKNEKNIKINRMYNVSNNANKTYAGYISTATGIKVADQFSNSPFVIFFSGRLFNMLISFIIIFFAIKITPKYKKILLFIATMPMFIQQICSVSYDAILNAICLFYFAYCIKLIYNNKKVNVKDSIILILLLYIIYTIKPVYLPIAILILFIPKENYKSILKKYLNFILIISSILLIDKFITSFVYTPIGDTTNVMKDKQLKYLLNNPLNIFSIAVKTFKIYGTFYLQGLVGYFGWFKFHLWNLFVYFDILVLIALSLNEKNILYNKIKKNYILKKVLLLIMILISVAGIFGAMYLYWSKYKLDYVDGVQGRYFLPLLPFATLLIVSIKEKIIFKKETLYSFINIGLIETIIVLIIYFY